MRDTGGRPPRLAQWILERVLPIRDVDAVLGDLDEALSGQDGPPPRCPRLWYWGQVALFTVAYSVDRLRPRGSRRRRDPSDPLAIREAFMVSGWWRELRVSVRTLRRRPGFVAATVGTLALGIGATTAIFSVINGALLTPLPFPEPDRLVWLSESWHEQAVPGGNSMNPANLWDVKAGVRSIEGVTAYTSRSVNLSGGDRPQRVAGLQVGSTFFSTLGVRPLLGRDFTVEDDTEGGPQVAILTEELWNELFGGNAAVLGSDIVLNDTPHRIIGVVPAGTDFPGLPRIFTPLQLEGSELSRSGRWLNAIGRLAEGAGLDGARQEVMAAYAPLADAHAQNENWSAWADPLDRLVINRGQERSLGLLAWSVGLVLLIACLNVANLLLVRTEGRTRELAVRVALGAGRSRLVPHFLAEGLLLSLIGGALGVLVGYGGLEAIKRAFSGMIPRAELIALDATTLGFALVLTVITGLVVGLVPILRMRSLDLQADLREGSRGSSAAGSRLRQLLVVGEIALAMVILAVAGLLGNSFYRVATIDVGIREPEQVLVAQVVLGSEYSERAERVAFFEEVLRRTEALPAVESAGLTSRLPLFGGTNFTTVPVVGDPDRSANFVEWRMVTPGFFDAVGVELEEGRMISAVDAAPDTLRTVLITRELARQLFPDERAVGQRIDLFGDDVGLEVIGVVSDLRDMGHERPPPPGTYAATGNATAPSSAYLLIRSGGDPLRVVPQLRSIVRELDADLPVFGTRTLDDVVRQRLGGRRFSVSLLLLFAALAVALGAIGIYGVMSYAVSQRTREMGVRLALGARHADVVGLVLGHGIRLTVLGLILGLVGALISTRLVSSQLYGVEQNDPLTYTAVSAVLATVALLASYLPARRASRTDPLEALRAE